MAGMKVDEMTPVFSGFDNFDPALQGENAFNEILPDERIMKASFLLHGNERKMLHENPGKDTDTLLFRHAFFLIDLDPFHPAARRITFKDESAEIFLFQFRDPLPGPANHPFGVILLCPGGHKVRGVWVSHQPHGFPRDTETAFHLRTDGPVLDILTEGVGEKSVQSVAAVITDIFAQ